MNAARLRGALAALVATATLSAAASVPAAGAAADRPSAEAVARHADAVRAWRDRRDRRLRSEDGWLTLVGLDWLGEGANTVGAGKSNAIVLPGGPQRWGTVYLDGDTLRFERTGAASVTVDGEPVAAAPLVPDDAGAPTVVASGDLRFHVIHRGSYALRVQDRQAPARVNFRGIETFPIDYGWRFDARFEPAPEGTTIEIADVLGHVAPTPVYGHIEFERNGRTHRLVALQDEDARDLWLIFADRTSGRETYGAGRFLHSDGMPADGHVVVDFNKAYNPPCAFSDFATCPLPPPENRLDLAVTAGEKDYHATAGGH